MLGPRSSRFHQAALQSGLIDEAGLAACWDLIPPERRTPEAIDRRLARQAISTGRLTLWQAQQLLAGRVSGFQIDKYVLLNLLGRGGMGRVFLARDVRLNRMVALKLLSQERMNNPRAMARFRREAKVGAQLQHENLVRVYDEGESAGVLYLVMEHIDGKNVGQLIGDLGKLPWPYSARLARQVALGLEHARLKDLIHRDVNPCNILVTQDGTAKLTDLGLAIDLNDLDNVTRDGATVGTFDYVSPEQAKNSRSVDTRADLYSLGCTLFHMIAGRVPFPMASLPEKLYAHQLHDPEPLTELAPEVPQGLAEIVRRLMRKAPDDRFQTPAELAAALEPFAIETGWTTTPSAVNPPPVEGAGSGEGPSAVEESSAGLTAVSPTTPGPGIGESFFPLDLGPVEPLAGNLHKPGWVRSSADLAGVPRPRQIKVGMVAALGFSAVVVAAVVATLANLASSKISGNATSSGAGGTTTASHGQPGSTATSAGPLVAGAIVVRFRDGSSEAVADLKSAIARAVRDRAEVILAAGSTVRLTNEPPVRIPDGGLTIRGAAGAPPTIEITMKGTQPAFLVGANLKLVDLIVTVRADTASDAAVWQAERDLTLERCVFRSIAAETGAPAEPAALIGSRFLLAEGPMLAVTGCLFVGFDRPIEFNASPEASAVLDQSIFVAGQPGDQAPLVGRTLTIRSAFGGGAGVRLTVTACSSRSDVFLAVDQFSAEAPLTVAATGSAIWAKTLLEFEGAGGAVGGDKPEPSPAMGTVRWQGRSNQFHVVPAETPWARLSSAVPLLNSPTTLHAWAAGGREVNSQTKALRFASPAPSESSQPGDYAFQRDDAQPTGADFHQVGPRTGGSPGQVVQRRFPVPSGLPSRRRWRLDCMICWRRIWVAGEWTSALPSRSARLAWQNGQATTSI